MPVIWLLVVPLAVFFVGMGYVIASAGPVLPDVLPMALWCVGLAVVLWLFGLGWEAVLIAAGNAALFACVLVPAGVFNTVRSRRERRALQNF